MANENYGFHPTATEPPERDPDYEAEADREDARLEADYRADVAHGLLDNEPAGPVPLDDGYVAALMEDETDARNARLLSALYDTSYPGGDGADEAPPVCRYVIEAGPSGIDVERVQLGALHESLSLRPDEADAADVRRVIDRLMRLFADRVVEVI